MHHIVRYRHILAVYLHHCYLEDNWTNSSGFLICIDMKHNERIFQAPVPNAELVNDIWDLDQMSWPNLHILSTYLVTIVRIGKDLLNSLILTFHFFVFVVDVFAKQSK